MFIYLIVNHVTGKYYVGQHKSKNLKKYLQSKLSDAKAGRNPSSHLFRSMRKHPKDAWSIHALLSDVQTKLELDQYEKDFIAFLRARDPNYGYNIALGGQGGGMLGHAQSLQTIEKIRKALAGKQCYPRTLENERKRKFAYQASVQVRVTSGSYFESEAINKIRGARARQDERGRLIAHHEWEKEHGGEARVRAAASHRGKKHKLPEASRAALVNGVRKGHHVRYHVKRGISESTCKFCSVAST